MRRDGASGKAFIDRSATSLSVEERDAIVTELYPWLNARALTLLKGEAQVSLSPGELVHEAVLRLLRSGSIKTGELAQVRSLASTVMRHVIVDHVRSKKKLKRAHYKVTLVSGRDEIEPVDFGTLHESLLRLSALDPQIAQIVEMRFFGGMTIADVADVTGLSATTVKQRWSVARAWLLDALSAGQ